MVEAGKQDVPQREIGDANYALQQEIGARRRIVVGVNSFTDAGDGEPTPTLRIDEALERKQIDRVQGVRARRDTPAVEATPTSPQHAATTGANLTPPLLECARAHVSEGEIVGAPQQVFGSHTETPVF